MKHRLFCVASILLSLLLFPACSNENTSEDTPVAADAVRVIEQSDVWTLGERYPLKYSILTYFVTYEAKDEPFCLKATRNKKETGMSTRVIESRNVNGIVFALCESRQQKNSTDDTYTFYECYTGNYRYFIGRESSGFRMESVLSMDDAIRLIYTPEMPKGDVKMLEAEWNAQYRTESCNLEILIRPNDGGALAKSVSATYQAQTEGDATYYISSSGDDIIYSNGVHSVQIRQADIADAEKVNYRTLSECEAILALIG